MQLAQLDWEVLDRLRETFLSDERSQGPYWHTVTDLECYDLTYGERIGWKWDAVLRELRRLGWSVPSGVTVLDWGCGSGVAGRRVVDYLGAGNVARLLVHDHSPLAMDFARHRAQQAFPGLATERAGKTVLAGPEAVDLLVLSHVLNELDAAAQAQLEQLAQRAGAVFWVEPGTHEVSRALGAWRERLRGGFSILAPCPHTGNCGMFAPGNERHWCHFFAPPPPEIFADSNWVKFGQRAGIDLRSLPYAYLALDRRAAPDAREGTARVIGEPRFYKGYAKLFSCDASGIRDLTLQKRDAPELFRQLKRGGVGGVQRWVLRGDRIGGTGCD